MTNSPILILADMIQEKLEEHADLDVLTFVSIDPDGQVLNDVRTYEMLWRNGQNFAHALDEAGMSEGKSFALLMENHPEFVEAMVGASITNTVYVPIDPRTKGDRLSFMLSHTDCEGVIVADYSLSNLLDVVAKCPKIKWIWILGDTGGEAPGAPVEVGLVSEILAKDVAPLEVRAKDPNDPMQMLFTSGTTGDPKAILAPHARFGSVAHLGAAIGLQEGDRPYTGLSLTHANAQLITLGNTLAMGLRGVISQKFTKSRLWEIIREHGCTMFNLLGGMTTALFAEPRLADDGDNPVRYVFSAGMPKAIWSAFEDRYNVEIFEFYGTAEGGLTLNPPGGPKGSIGKPPPSQICAILNEDDSECPAGEHGEICFANADGSPIGVQYFKNPEASAAKVRNGWFRSGDIGFKDEDGWVYFLYRAGGGIRRNGDFIDPATIEKTISEIDGVADVFVYGVPTKENAPGEKEVVAAVECEVDNFDPATVFDACGRTLSRNSVPTFIQLVDKIPKTASEKPQERILLDRFDPCLESVFVQEDAALESAAIGKG